jgi:phosphoglycolate phosphatase-like HAD superfamily hydrolase
MRLVLFDVDGTLLDNPGEDDARYLRAFDAAFGIRDIDTDWSRYPSATDSCITRELLARHFGRPATDDEIVCARAAYVAELRAAAASGANVGPPMRGVADALAAMSADGWSAAIATGGWRASAMLKLSHSRLPVTSLPGAFADDHLTREGIATIARERAEEVAGRKAARVVYVGDATWDVKACAALGLPFVGIAKDGRADRLRRAGATTVISDYLDGFLDALDAAVAPKPC